jgi:hypothetical protein
MEPTHHPTCGTHSSVEIASREASWAAELVKNKDTRHVVKAYTITQQAEDNEI